ncbi:amino acid adenylation domain-containing protein, partial [Photorhabdus sp. S7-51]
MASMVPMTVEAEFNKPWSEVVVAVDNELALLAQHGTYSRDLFSRFPALSVIPELRTCYPWPIAVSVVPDSRLGDQERSSELLTFQINTQGGFRWIYDENRLDTAVILRMSEHLQQLLSLEKTNEAIPIGQLNLLSETERMLLLKTWNATAMPYPEDLYIHQLFEQQVAKTPEATALVYENQSLSYAELNTRANRLAHQLIALGVEPDQRVAICVSRSPAMVVGLLAVLKAGGAYVSLDPSYPVERLAYMLNDAAPVVLLTQSVLADSSKHAFSAADYTIVLLDAPDAAQVEQPDHNPEPQTLGLTSRHPAYIIYTSGSTGLPKGVEMPQAGLLNLLQWHRQSPSQPAGNGKTLQFAALGFDVAFQEIFTTLCEGGCLVLINESLRRQPEQLLRLISQQRIDRIFLPYIALQHLAEAASHSGEDFSCLAHIVTAGEQLRITPAIQRFLQRAEGCRLHNHYGPTESHVTTAYILDQDPNRWPTLPPIGRPIANNRIYILDTCGQPVPLGGLGEIYIAGQGVARGYLNRPELTAERFLADPFSDKPDARMYRTGDLARYLPDGNLEFLGRTDQQVKIRGFRIEPGEIEARLAEHPAVREAVVLARGEGLDKRLVAYVAADVEEELVNNLRERLSQVLPEYMVPAAVVRLDRFPLTPNGKLDRRALPVPGEDAFARQRYAAPQGATETALAAIWRELLGIEKISRHDNFFALGGHSLLAVRVMNRIMTVLGVELPLAALFHSPSLAALAQAAQKQDRPALPAILPVSRTETLPLSLAQQRLWFLAQLDGVSETYHIPLALHLRGRLDIAAWQQALNAVFARHEALRTVFVSVDGQPQIHLLAADDGLPLVQHDLRGHPDADTELERLCAGEMSAPFDLSRGPLIRAELIRLTEEDYRFLLTQHHIVSDGWSVNVLINELNALYAAFLAGQPDPLPPLAIQYPDYAAWQHQWFSAERTQVQSDYWRTTLADAPVLLALPTDRPRPPEPSFAGQILPVHLGPELTTALKQLSQQHGVTLFMTVLSAWGVVLSRLSGQEDIIIGTPSAGRSRQEVESLMGFFVNTLALRMHFSGALTVAELLTQVRQTALAAQAHQDLPFEQVVEIVQPPRRLAHTPLFQVMFAWQSNEHTDWALPGLMASPIDQTLDTVKFDLELDMFEDNGAISGNLRYATALFDQTTMERHIGYLRTVLQVMVANHQQRIGEIDILTSAERRLLLETWNATETPYPEDLCIHQLFERQAATTPDAIALVHENQSLSYAELNARANRLARQLIALGVRPGGHIALLFERSIALVVAQLAVLKAGAVYVPIDPDTPDERKHWVIQDCAAQLLLTDEHMAIPDNLAVPLLRMREETDPGREDDGRDLNLTRRGSDAVYVMYTSGSTGVPKGVIVSHRAVIRLVINNGYAEIEPDDRVAFTANPAFDASTFEVWAPLLNGGTLVVIDHATLLTPPALERALQLHHITILWLTIGLFNRLVLELSSVLPQIKTLIFGGDIPDLHVIASLLENNRPQHLLQAYGPTEGATFSTIYRITALAPEAHSIPIGQPIANTRVYLLDTNGRPVPLGATGEMYIGGDGVARGYLNRPELTAERFLADPFSDKPDARMYRTGDLARYLPDGNLEFLGRTDQQVKIRGFRIEPGEIEARLAEHPAVREAVVLARGEGLDKRLVAYVAADVEEGLVNNLRERLSQVLPEYMVPAAVVRLDRFPLTPNGKLDRRALPVPGEDAFARQRYAAPQGATETALAAVWRELLGIEKISRHDNFFALGGHSLLAVRVMNRIMAVLGVELPLMVLFNSPSLAALAQAVQKQDSPALPAILPVSRTETLPLSLAQQRLWFLAQLDGVSETYHIPLVLHLRGQLDIVAWQQALNTVFARHEALRTIFVSVDGQPQIRLLAKESGVPLVQHDLRGHLEADTILKQLVTEAVSVPFDLSREPLIRAVLIRLADDDYQFLLTQHHIVSDGWSINILIHELNVLYAAFLSGRLDPLPPLAIQYPDYAVWQHQWLSAERTQAQSDYWHTVLADAPMLLELPIDRPRPAVQSFVGHAVPIRLDPALTAALKHLSQQHGVTLFMTLLSAWGVVLSRLSGQGDIIIGTPSAGRNQQEVEPLIGFFVNTLALRIAVSGEFTVTELLKQVRQTVLMAQVHQDLPFEQVVEIVQPPRRLAHSPLFQVMFAWQNNEHMDWALPGLMVSPIDQTLDTVKFDLELELYEEASGISGALHYSTALFERPTIERHTGYLQTALQAMVANAQQKVESIDILSPAERRLLLETWNATEMPYPDTVCLHQLFEQQAAKTPDAIALVYEEQTLSYAELNTRANRLAHQLVMLGVEPDQLVAICVSRSLAMVVGVLAILKAGGAYVPLDPAYPGERLVYMLTDTASAIVLADNIGRAALGRTELTDRTVLDPNIQFDQPDNNPQIATLTPRHLAYVIYTSGSIGTPKGVMIEHQALYQHYLSINERYAFTAQDRVLQFSAFAFDVSVEECFLALCNGASLVIRNANWLASIPEFITLARKNRITVLFLPMLFWSELATREKRLLLPDTLRFIIIGGEDINKSAVQNWFMQDGHCPRLLNAYGPTETTVTATCQEILSPTDDYSIGRPLKNTYIYLLDNKGQPVPLGCVGEIYIGGAGVARGYLNQPELTEERFLADPFSDKPDARMYRTGDLARYLPDGNLEFLGRTDQQVKIRGFRIEPGEIEARLAEHPAVREAVVLARGEGLDKRLVAYVAADVEEGLVNNLRERLSQVLPEYMVPAAVVRLDRFPLTPNGKLDRRALPVPGEDAFARQRYAAPQGATETALAAVWRELLGIEKISRHDNFFALGGHSLLAVRVIEHLRQQGLTLAVRDLFQTPVLANLAQKLEQYAAVPVSANVITPDTCTLTPAMLPLINLTPADIDRIVGQVPGGLSNLQDIYALSPLQDGILFHHLLASEGDPYLLAIQMIFADRALLDRYLTAVQQVVNRHDILRTAFIWQGLSEPAQVVWRQAPLSVTELTLDPADGPVSEQLSRRFDPRHYRLNLSEAPLLQFVVARDTEGRWCLLELQHHLIGDHTTLEVLHREIRAFLTEQAETLPAPVPFRNLVA